MGTFDIADEQFTVEQGIKVQADCLQYWKAILKEDVYAEVEKWATRYNHLAINGYDIVRGDKLKFYVCNLDIK